MKLPSRFFENLVDLPYRAMIYNLSLSVRREFPDAGILETEDFDFDVDAFAEAGGCCCLNDPSVPSAMIASWEDQRVQVRPQIGVQRVTWRGHSMLLLRIACGNAAWMARQIVVAESDSIAEAFFAAVCTYNTEGNQSILVADSEGFRRDDALLGSLSAYTEEGVRWMPQWRQIVENCLRFFDQHELYESKGIAWRRGVLLHGPPGNGKTYAVKTLVSLVRKPVVYVRSFRSTDSLEMDQIRNVFRRARTIAPCLVILEDLDCLIGEEALSYFLNELDGLNSNHGLLTVATTNQMERIDPALTERPSRVDRKIEFGLPDASVRRRFLEHRGYQVSDLLVQDTEGFSIAFLAEWAISYELARIEDPLIEPEGLQREVAQRLRTQLAGSPESG